MKKSNRSIFSIFSFVLVLASGCTPVTTPIPPISTFTAIPPTLTKLPMVTPTPAIAPLPEALSDYLKWREVVFSVTSAQVNVVTKGPNQIYGVIMDVGLSDDFIITITAFPTGESSLRTTIGGGVIGLGGDEFIAEHAKHIVMLAQSLSDTAKQANNNNLPTSEIVYFYFLTTSGLMLSEASIAEVSNPTHPFFEMFGQFTEIKRRSEELIKSQ